MGWSPRKSEEDSEDFGQVSRGSNGLPVALESRLHKASRETSGGQVARSKLLATCKPLSRGKWVHCHHGMARPRVADRGGGLQIWKVAANILNKQSRTADSKRSSSLGVGRGLTTLPRKTQYLLRNTTHNLRSGRIIWHNLSTGKDMRFGTWNVRSLYRSGSLKTVAKQSSPATRHAGSWGEWRYSSYSFLTTSLRWGEWSASSFGAALCPGEGTPDTHCTGGWVGLRAGLDTEVRGQILCPCRGSNPDRPV
jgi:hypothetical protein